MDLTIRQYNTKQNHSKLGIMVSYCRTHNSPFEYLFFNNAFVIWI